MISFGMYSFKKVEKKHTAKANSLTSTWKTCHLIVSFRKRRLGVQLFPTQPISAWSGCSAPAPLS
jgi:hypothetical protein